MARSPRPTDPPPDEAPAATPVAIDPAAGPMIAVKTIANLCATNEEEIRQLSIRHLLPPIRKGTMPLIATVQAYVTLKRERKRSAKSAGELIDKSPQWVRHLIAEGFIVKDADGMVRDEDVFRGYIRWLTDEQRRASKVQAESRVRDARARELELRIAEREGRLIDINDMERVVDTFAGTLRASLSGLPARVTRDLVLRRTIEQAIDSILGELADYLRQERDRLRPAA